jgi:Na+:H+ antiporter, NhaA family
MESKSQQTDQDRQRIESDETAYRAPLENAFRKFISPIEDFTQNQVAGGVVLIVCLVIALGLANSSLRETYQQVIHFTVGFNFGGIQVDKSIHEWINDGLMTIFFLVVGLEIKREVLVGELAGFSRASLPVIAAMGGMLVPGLIYFLMNQSGAVSRGWGIPTATDIAFAVGVMALLGKRVPAAVMTFLLALAIADDLGAVVIIGIFYTKQLYLTYLLIGIGLLGLLMLFNTLGVRAITPYMVVGALIWVAFLQSGIHATLSGVLVAMIIPTRPKYHPNKFSDDVRCLIDRFDQYSTPVKTKSFGWSAFSNQQQAEIIEEMEILVDDVASPLRKLAHALSPLIAFGIIPLFALANAGVEIHIEHFAAIFQDSVTLGVMCGLVVGKFIGISLATWLAVKLKIGKLPKGASFKHILGVGLLGGIGFTMSMFVTELAFSGIEERLVAAKTGILLASAIAGALGFTWFRFFVKPQPENSADYDETQDELAMGNTPV